MRKVFISTIPMQPKLSAYKYKSEAYADSTETGYPITVSIENNVQDNDNVLVLSITTHSEDKMNASEERYDSFTEQVRGLLKNKNISLDFTEIKISDRATASSHHTLLRELQEVIKDGDEIYADITYGFKSNPVVIFAALNHAYQLLDDVDIAEIIYGNLYNGTNKISPEIFEVTSLFYINSLNGTLGNMPISAAEKNQLSKM